MTHFQKCSPFCSFLNVLMVKHCFKVNLSLMKSQVGLYRRLKLTFNYVP